MVPTSITTLAILLLAIAPGYLAIHAWNRSKTWTGFRGDLDTVLRSLVASGLVQVAMFPLALRLGILPDVTHENRHVGQLFLWLVLTVIVIPVGVGFPLGAVWDFYFGGTVPAPEHPGFWRFMLHRARVPEPPTAWDAFFLYQVPDSSCLVIEFEDGSKVAGSWEYPGVAKTSPNPPGLFLPQEWVLDWNGDLSHIVPASSGLLVPNGDKIKHIRVLRWDEPEEATPEQEVQEAQPL